MFTRQAKKIILVVTSCLVMGAGMCKGEAANLRVGIFSEAGFPDGAGVRPATWYTNELTKLGCVPVVLSADDMSNAERLNRKALDVLILPNGGSIPYEAAYLIPKFLAEGGHLITTRLPVAGYKNDPSKPAKWTEKARIMSYPGAWQVRFMRWKSAQRSLNSELKLGTNLTTSVSAHLPPIAGPLNASMSLPDKMNMIKSGVVDGKKEARDSDTGSDNMETAGNILLPIYYLPSGEPTDFLAYRYHNNYYNGATLVHLGQVGESLMKGDKAGDILQSCLKLCEEKYSGEQSPEWYEHLIGVQRKVSEYGQVFINAYYKTRDGMAAALYAGNREAYHDARAKLNELKNGFEAVIREKQALDKLLPAGTDCAGQDQRRKALLEKIAAEEQVCGKTTAVMDALLAGIKMPERIKVRHVLGGIQAAAGMSSFGLYELRTDMFQTMKELGINAWNYNQWFDFFWVWDDPAIKPLMEGIKYDIMSRYQYPDYKMVISEQGKLDLVTGKVEETPREIREPEKLEKTIREYVGRAQAYPIIRYWGGSERGLHNNYWGEQAREEFVEHLKGKYGEISRLNERWLTAYTNFNDIKLITHQPKTAVEHANWEDWRSFREMQLFKARETVYKLFKKYAPNTLYGSCISSGCRYYPIYGVDYYELTKIQDISSMDGTAIPVNCEWTYLDLIAKDKKVWTMEWGVYYFPPADILKGCRGLRQQAWQEISGGHIGINAWVWRNPGFPGNSVDTTGLPTQYGWELKRLLSDFRKIEHVLLDGKRVDPEIQILFSNTTKSHDQGWENWCEQTFSAHLTAVDSLYGRFIKLKFAARVLDEGALRDGADLSKCRMLIVPQAQYLSRETQDQLLDYARNGGCLVIEGLSGKYDNYGNSSSNLFKTLGVALGMVKTKEVQLMVGMAGVLYGAQDKKHQEQFYAPVAVEGGKVLLTYVSEEPAIVSMGLGKGKVIVSGLPFSALEPKGTELIMQELCKEAELTAKYQCDDENLILREWEYGNELYLICAYPDGKDSASRFFLKIRGEWEVEDYMLGLKIPVEQDGAYTKFEGVVLSPGGCVYRLKPVTGRQNKMADKKAMVKPAKSEGNPQSLQSGQNRTLPFKGELQVQNGEIEMGGYKFRIAVAIEKDFEKGRVFLTVQRGAEERRQELKTGQESLFVFRNEALRVKCENQTYNYPEGATVAIEAVERPKLRSVCGIKTNGVARELFNGMVSLKVLPAEGGRIVELKTWPDGINHVSAGGIREMDGGYPGSLMNQRFAVASETATPEECKIVLGMENATAEGLKERKEIRLKRGMALAGVNVELRNEGKGVWEGWFRAHPELNVGGMADGNDVIYVPEKDGIKAMIYSAGQQYTLNLTEGWTACCDAREKLAYVSKFNLNEVKTVYLCFGDNFYNIELWSPNPVRLKKGESVHLNHEIYMVKGVSGVGGYGQGWAGNLIMPAGAEKWPQDKKMKFVFEIGNACLEKQSAQVRVALMRAGKEVRMYYEGKAEASYEEGFNKEIEAGFDGLAEGEYEFEARIFIGAAESLTIHKTISLLGKKLERDRAACKAYQERLDACLKNKNITSDQKFNAVQILEELKAAVERQDDEVIRQKREALESILGEYSH